VQPLTEEQKQAALDGSILVRRHRYAVCQGQIYAGLPDGQDGWHAWPIELGEVPSEIRPRIRTIIRDYEIAQRNGS
jgi:hypothetical protein